jgi:prepilin-type N-terminal cleavage/methylation domain-containing protein
MNRRRQHTGFTLLEVLLAVTILGLVIGSVYSAWNASLTGWKRASEVTDTFQRERIVLDTLSELAKSAVYFVSDPDLYQVVGTDSDTEGDSVSFITGSDALLPPNEMLTAGLRRVTIGLERDDAGDVVLTLANSAALMETGDEELTRQTHVLSRDVIGFGVRYRDPRDGTWKTSWEESGVMPVGFEFTVAFSDPTDPKAAPLTLTRAVELPAALGAMQLAGMRRGAQDTTNEVTQQEVPTVDPDDLKKSQNAGEGES